MKKKFFLLNAILFFIIMNVISLKLTPFIYLEAKLDYLIPEVKLKLPHDPAAFTQGLAIYKGELYESTGLYGQSSLRQLHLQTGEVIKKVSVPPSFFAEGIAVTDKFIVQLTWKEKKILIYDRQSFQLLNTINYKGEGWGLCSNNGHFLMSHGTSLITQHSLLNWENKKQCDVQFNKSKIDNLNDLECVDDSLYLNVWQSDIILKANKFTGEVTGIIDASNLLTWEEKKSLGPDDVLNGIAYNPTTKTFWITGKRWPWLFEVQFIPIIY